eukprot:4595303-Prymnesium_polylepis.2
MLCFEDRIGRPGPSDLRWCTTVWVCGTALGWVGVEISSFTIKINPIKSQPLIWVQTAERSTCKGWRKMAATSFSYDFLKIENSLARNGLYSRQPQTSEKHN